MAVLPSPLKGSPVKPNSSASTFVGKMFRRLHKMREFELFGRQPLVETAKGPITNYYQSFTHSGSQEGCVLLKLQ